MRITKRIRFRCIIENGFFYPYIQQWAISIKKEKKLLIKTREWHEIEETFRSFCVVDGFENL